MPPRIRRARPAAVRGRRILRTHDSVLRSVMMVKIRAPRMSEMIAVAAPTHFSRRAEADDEPVSTAPRGFCDRMRSRCLASSSRCIVYKFATDRACAVKELTSIVAARWLHLLLAPSSRPGVSTIPPRKRHRPP